MIADLHPLDGLARQNCFEYRIGIEGESAAAAARNRTSRDLRILQRSVERLERNDVAGLAIDEDYAFHMAVAKASGNAYFVSALSSLKDYIFEGMLLARAASGLRIEDKMMAIRNQHRAVYQAIAYGDADEARFAMRDHLLRCKQSTSHWDHVPS